MKKWRIPGACCTLLLFLAGASAFPETAFARLPDVAAVMAAEDEENGYRYECAGIGGFSTNISPGEKAAAAILTADQGLRWELYQDGVRQEYENGGLIFENGCYEYILYPADASEPRGVFSFEIQGQYEIQDGEALFVADKNPGFSITYEPEGNGYRHTLPNGESYFMTIPCGAYGVSPVSVEFSDGIAVYQVQKDGKTIFPETPYYFQETGLYQMDCMSSFGDDGQAGGIYQFTVSFILLPGQVAGRDILFAPVHFSVQSVVRDGRMAGGSGDYVLLQEDGLYRIVFAFQEDPQVQYTLSVLADNTPPSLVFSSNIYDPDLKAPLEFFCPEPGCSLAVYRNGIRTADTSGIIREGGQYWIQVTDPAGNLREYRFQAGYGGLEIKLGEIILLTLFLASVGLWLIYQRGHMRVL